jgi:hypothetical protein
MKIDLRNERTGEPFGLYYRVDAIRDKKAHEIYLYASRFEISPTGVLILFDKDNQPYRSFHPSAWRHIATVSMCDGAEMWEQHDWVDEEEVDVNQ